jgi:hypothetical protein
MIGQGAVTLDGAKLDDPNQRIVLVNGMKLKMGKRRWAKVIF